MVQSHFLIICCLLITCSGITAQDDSPYETVSVPANDALMLVGDIYRPDTDAENHPALLLFHMLGGDRSAYAPLIPDLLEAGYVVVSADLRGHGDTGGDQVWEQAEDDVQVWIDWIRTQDFVDQSRIGIIGSSIGANLALIGCANDADCIGVIAISPGLDYFNIQPEIAMVEGLAERAVLLIASHGDVYSADTIKHLFTNSTGDVSARLYRGSAHGTFFFRTDYDEISHGILSWLAEHVYPT